MEEEKKTLGYDWEFGHEELMLEVDAYRYDNRLYIGLTHMEEGYEESFADLTINLAHMPVERNEAYIVVKHLLELQTDGELRTWVKWAEDCVAMGQYAGFRELPQNKAVEKWLDSYYHVFSAIQSEFSKETAIKVLNLSQEKLRHGSLRLEGQERIFYR